MHGSFPSNCVRPNLPLRKPSSSPLASFAPRPRPLTAIGDGPTNSPVSDRSAVLGSIESALMSNCNICGHKGGLRCKRCKKTPYCSVTCQAKDWMAHRHTCKSIDPEPAKEKTAALPVTGDRASMIESKHCDASSLQRVYIKDLHVRKIIKGTDIQATVVEFFSPGRFFILAQSPELLEALQSISQELQKTYSCPSVTTYVPHAGEVCAVKFSFDMKWYRGLVQTLAADQKTAYILYIDFGNEENVPVDRIKPLAANIQPFCPCAMECRIAGVVPWIDKWSAECCMSVKQLLAGKTFTVKLVETLEKGRVYAVDILLSMGKKFSTFLLEHRYAAEETVNEKPTPQEITAMVSASLENFRCRSDGKDDNTWAQSPEPLTQAVGDSFSVVVTHLQSPDEIIVQKVQNAGVIQDLQLKLREHCSQPLASQNFRPAPGTVCGAQFSEDKQWYRAKVLAYSSEERVCVGYLDFGNSEEVDLGHLRPISAPLLALPMQAVRCGLAGVQPVGEVWSEECLLGLQRSISNRILRVEIQIAQKGKALVAMIDEASDPQANVAELLTAAGFAEPTPLPPASSDQQPEQTAAAEPHVPPPACEPLVWSCAELPCDGQTVALLASMLGNPLEFYCRIDNLTGHQRLVELGAQLKEHCETQASPFEPKVGEPCCAMFPGNGEWRRVLVNELSDGVSVHFVDHGHSMKVEKKRVRSIKPQLLTLPFQAIRCWLTGVEPLGSEWSGESVLCLQNLVGGVPLSARVFSRTEQGYGVELESRGINVAAALISAQLAKVPGGIPKETTSGSGPQEKMQEHEQSQINEQASNPTGAKEMPAEGPTAMPSEVPPFPVDWKTVELPLNISFQPCFAAISSPSLFYLLDPNQVAPQKLQEVMMQLAAYCSNIQASSSSTVLSRPAAGAVCCAKFTADNNWYRAVALEVGENEMGVIYADYGNTEKVPFSRILPIPTRLLQLPFQITRCTLSGKERFPAEFPEEIQQLFHSLLLSGVLATVQSFNGSANVLSLSQPPETGGGDLTTMLLDALQAQAKSHPSLTQKADQTNSSTSSANTTIAPAGLLPTPDPVAPQAVENTPAKPDLTMTPRSAPQSPPQKKNASAASVIGALSAYLGSKYCTDYLADPVQNIIQMEPPCKTSKTNDSQGCCCLNLTTKVDHLEQLVQLQLSLIMQLVGNTK
ncbi:tudor domain-containing protein 1 isoform X2 [Eleginops maclovinus]|uniref:tudor domain-containing protein 1 isoform X2 n=1 Tax=Eleginops maclovinus TaxID=56733 RepID=UPI003080261B